MIYEGGLRCQEALGINIEDIDWTERAIRILGKGRRIREMFFSRRLSRYLDDYLKQRGEPSVGALFITARKARSPRRADLTADGHARLSYRQADTLWKAYAPGWDLLQLRHTAISARAAQGYTEVELKRFSGQQSLRSLEVYIAHNRAASTAAQRSPSDGAASGISQSSTIWLNRVGCSSCGRCPVSWMTSRRADGRAPSRSWATETGKYGSPSVQMISAGTVSCASRGRSAARSAL
jgi:hypothetical protein